MADILRSTPRIPDKGILCMFPPMATRLRSSSPQTEPFPPLDVPRTPISVNSISYSALTSQRDNQSHSKSQAPAYTVVSPKSPPRSSPRPLTGAAALADAKRQRQQQQERDSRQTSPNPAVTAMHALMAGPGISRPSDNPSHSSNFGDDARKPSHHLTVPVTTSAAEASQPSPVSLRSFGSTENVSPGGAITVTAHEPLREYNQFVAEPAEMGASSEYPEPSRSYNTTANTGQSHKASTYPGPMTSETTEGPSRASTATKRHKCPYCATDFTRHHNLKSHLLTHSQEKPYVCQTCQSRFRRLHDLKRHTKLHTGERPHICDKCGRRFARGDALARHNKGPGGCAGRRSSFGGDDDSRMGDENMDGLEYGDNGRDEDDEEENPRRGSEPSRKRAHVEDAQDADRAVYRQHSSTYPPPLSSRPYKSIMGPPTAILPSSSTVTSPGEMSTNPMSSITSHGYSNSNGNGPPGVVLGEGGISHSPKPLSPGQRSQHRLSVAEPSSILRNRSPSLTQIQQAHQSRIGQSTPPHMTSQHPPQLPSLAGLSESARFGHGHQIRLPHHNHQHQPGSIHGSNPGSLSSHTHGSGSSMRDIASDHEWRIAFDNLEARFSRMKDEYDLRIARLQEDLIALKGQITFQQR